MKKARIMLSAIGIFALVGGALAFNAQKFNTFVLFTLTGSGANETCTIVGSVKTAGSPDATLTTTGTFIASGLVDPDQTTTATDICQDVVTYYAE